MYVLPFVLIISVFILKPVTDIFYSSLFIKKLDGTMIYIGLKNFTDIFSKAYFGQIVSNTLLWVVTTVFFKNLFGLLLALIMNKNFRGRKCLQLMALLPWATPWMISTIIFKWFFDGLYGYLNSFLYTAGFIVKPVDWLSNPNFAIWAVIIVNVWTAIPFCGFVYLAALNSIPNHLYEAAKLDGAGAGQTFLYVTFPQILPTVQLLTVLVTIWGINSFDMIYTMTDGGPVNASETLVTYLYRLGFKLQNIGQANALSVTVFLVMLVLVVLYFKMRRINDEHA